MGQKEMGGLEKEYQLSGVEQLNTLRTEPLQAPTVVERLVPELRHKIANQWGRL
jgi:hypothetical protein